MKAFQAASKGKKQKMLSFYHHYCFLLLLFLNRYYYVQRKRGTTQHFQQLCVPEQAKTKNANRPNIQENRMAAMGNSHRQSGETGS